MVETYPDLQTRQNAGAHWVKPKESAAKAAWWRIATADFSVGFVQNARAKTISAEVEALQEAA